MANQFLCLNDNKTEVMVIGSDYFLKQIKSRNLVIGDASVSPSNSARNIGAVFDESLSMKDHISHIAKGAWYHLRQISEIRFNLDEKSAKTLMHSFVSSRLDAFNGLLYGVPDIHLSKLQRIQNAAARVIAGIKKHDHITPTLMDLHWLPIRQRIDYKILILTYKCLHGMAPQYLSDLLHLQNRSRSTRSSHETVFIIPKTRTVKYGDRSFEFAAANLWKDLPSKVREAPSLDSFKSRLKTFLFKKAYL